MRGSRCRHRGKCSITYVLEARVRVSAKLLQAAMKKLSRTEDMIRKKMLEADNKANKNKDLAKTVSRPLTREPV
jgi:hypothetical protein